MNNIINRKKMSIDFEPQNYKKLKEYCDCHNNCSTSSVVNFLISNFLNLPEELANSFAITCEDYLNSDTFQYNNSSSFRSSEADAIKKTCHELIYYLTNGKCTTRNIPMKRIKIRTGYAYVPTSWIILDNKLPEHSEYIGIIECRNSDLYGIPHFVFFSEFPIYSITERFKKEIYTYCISAYPNFSEVLKKQVKPLLDENNFMINEEIWKKSPEIGFFQLPEHGVDLTFPYNAMFIRNSSSNIEET
ncbi:MAG: hypothetical protein J6B50_12770 [Lachnospiraceae bacterium]|nr:hypothetical protein [Lachnospiraceae bacterium]